MTHLQIRSLEEVSLNATPALRQLTHDGWILRLTGGATRRVNSVQPLYPGQLDLSEKIAFCESVYARFNLPTVFKMTDAAVPSELDRALGERGYEASELTSVEVCDLSSIEAEPAAKVMTWDEPVDGWLEAAAGVKGTAPSSLSRHREIMSLVCLPMRFVGAIEAGEVCSTGFGVLQKPWVGLFDIRTREDRRNQGLGHKLVSTILAWAKGQGASQAYLQVNTDNAPARRLYSRFGFREAYRYWYRSQGNGLAPGGR